jgi:hypothetical protein
MPFQIMPQRDSPALAAFLQEPYHVLRPIVLEVAQSQLGDGTGLANRKGHRRQDCPVT